jgi:hypothetical protein
MRRHAVLGFAIAFALIPASGAVAAPGEFPEQPGDHPATACAAVISHGQGAAHESATASGIVNALYDDACLGG